MTTLLPAACRPGLKVLRAASSFDPPSAARRYLGSFGSFGLRAREWMRSRAPVIAAHHCLQSVPLHCRTAPRVSQELLSSSPWCLRTVVYCRLGAGMNVRGTVKVTTSRLPNNTTGEQLQEIVRSYQHLGTWRTHGDAQPPRSATWRQWSSIVKQSGPRNFSLGLGCSGQGRAGSPLPAGARF